MDGKKLIGKEVLNMDGKSLVGKRVQIKSIETLKKSKKRKFEFKGLPAGWCKDMKKLCNAEGIVEEYTPVRPLPYNIRFNNGETWWYDRFDFTFVKEPKGQLMSQKEIDALLSTVITEVRSADKWKKLDKEWQFIDDSGWDVLYKMNSKLNTLFRAVKEK